jgi:hypothetical protein
MTQSNNNRKNNVNSKKENGKKMIGNKMPIADVSQIMYTIGSKRNEILNRLNEKKKRLGEGVGQDITRSGDGFNFARSPVAKDAGDDIKASSLAKQKPITPSQFEFMRSMLSEHLGNFVVFGYDMRGERILMTNANTPQEKDAMFQMAQTTPMALLHMFSDGFGDNFGNGFGD